MPDRLDMAIALMKQNKFSEAIPIFISLIEADSEDWSLYYMVGQCYRFLDNITEAVQFLSKSAHLNPNNAHIFLALGIAHQLAEEYELAIVTLTQAISLDPMLFQAYNSLGLTYSKNSQFREALEWYSRAAEGIVTAVGNAVLKDREKCYVDINSNGENNRLVLPYVLGKTHETLRVDPMYSTVKNNMGLCLMKLGDLVSAREQFRESIEFIPDGYNYPDPFRHLESIEE